MKLLFAAAAAVFGVTGIAHAQSFEPKAKGAIVVDFRATSVAPSGTDPVTSLTGAATGLKAKVEDDTMPTLGLAYFLTDHLAVEAIAGTTKHTVRAQGPGVDVAVKDIWVLPPVVTLQYHFAPAARVSPYVGAGVNYMLFYGGDDLNGFKFKVKDGFGGALQAGVDVALRDNWTMNLDVKKVYFDTTAVESAKGLKSKVTLDPVVTSVGLGYRL